MCYKQRMTISFLCVGIAFLLIYVPRVFVARAQARCPEGYDNLNPRAQQAQLDERGARARAAHANAFESFAPFAAAVIIAHLGKADPQLTTVFALIHVGARAVYPFLYIAGKGSLRSLIWMIGFAATGALFTLPLLRSPSV